VRHPSLRILDANLNRAREAMRVVEDYARFILDDQPTSHAIKLLRHELADATAAVAGQAILHRLTTGDVGTNTKADDECSRHDVSHVVTAAGKRLGEALRTLEEFLKIDDPPAAARIEALRYRFYTLEQTIAQTLRPACCDFASVRLYVLITESLCRRPWLDTCRQAIEGGADCLQLREKSLTSGELLKRAISMVELCREYKVKSIINDRPDIAVLSGADGAHVGQDDLPAREVRKLIGRERILGVSTHQISQARQARLDGADYIGVGPIIRSATKPRDILPGIDYAREVFKEIQIPAVAIAGISAQNVDEVMASGLRAVAVSSAVIACDDVRAAAAKLKEKLVSPVKMTGS
jgi:thiamine-phosphate pyrophosphorylase